MNRDIETAASFCAGAKSVVALSGAGISVDSGIPDFRSPGGLWSVFDPEEYATLDVFLRDPRRAWEFYRSLARTLEGKTPNPAHRSLAELETKGVLKGIVTQNIDGLHTAAGSQHVLEVHGEHRNLQCLRCGRLEPATSEHLPCAGFPTCSGCRFPLKPNVVLFGEWVRHMDRVDELMADCDLLLVIGTSAQVYPIADLPHRLLRKGGAVIEFNLERTALTPSALFFLEGRASATIPRFVEAVLRI